MDWINLIITIRPYLITILTRRKNNVRYLCGKQDKSVLIGLSRWEKVVDKSMFVDLIRRNFISGGKVETN